MPWISLKANKPLDTHCGVCVITTHNIKKLHNIASKLQLEYNQSLATFA